MPAGLMFPRWALRLFRFVLKQKLGKIILGEIDLDNLDIQLLKGTIQLKNLALNVDYLNQKLGTAPLVVKDGCIGSLSVKVPWKINRCDIEIKDLEVVFSPKLVAKKLGTGKGVVACEDTKTSVSSSPMINGDHGMHQDSGLASFDIHEGVKTIANLVKCLLSNFHVKIRNMIVAFDPQKEEFGNKSPVRNILIFHMMEIEYGTCLSENADTRSDSRSHNGAFLGMTKLMNFVTFRGATVELLHIVDEERELQSPSALGLGPGGSCKSAVPIFTGENGSFCGTLKLSMPWKNGSLDTGRVDADFYMDPVELRFQPSTIRFIIFLWESVRNFENNISRNACGKAVESEVSFRSAPHSHPPNSASCAFAIGPEGLIPSSGNLVTNIKSHIGSEASPNELLPGSHLILDWVPLAADVDKTDGAELDADLGASVDQFFECLDGMSFHSSHSGSGIWNWTCSVFNTISAASTLASGSLYIPTEQQHVETNINARIAGVSVILSFHDEKQHRCGDLRSCWETTYCSDVDPIMKPPHPEQQYDLPDLPGCGHGFVHYLEARFQGLNVTFQIFPQEIKLEAVLKQITVDDCFNFANGSTNMNFWDNGNELLGEVNLVHSSQTEVEGVLPPFPLSFQDPNMFKSLSKSNTANMDFQLESVIDDVQGDPQKPISTAKHFEVNILRTDDFSALQLSVISRHPKDKLKALISCCVKLPPAILWINLNTVNMLLELCSQIGLATTSDVDSKVPDVGSCCSQDQRSSSQTGVHMSNPTEARLRGSIILCQTRMILCFPLRRPEGSRCLYSHNDFIILDFCPSGRMNSVGDTFHVFSDSSRGNLSHMSFSSIYLNIGDFNVYVIFSPDRDASNKQCLSAKKIFSSNAGSCDEQSGIRIIWKAGPAKEADIAQRLWDVATSRNFCRNSTSQKKYEFASVATINDQASATSQLLKELISSSGFTFHVHFSRASVSMEHTEYTLLLHLISQLLDVFCTVCSNQDDADINENHAKEKIQPHDVKLSQSSLHLKCDILEISIKLEVLDVNKSFQKELPGSWSSMCLTVRDFELLSGSNLGRMSGSNLLSVSHGEGELWGSIVKTGGEVSGTCEDFMLLCARNSAMRRGDGDGANVLSSGSAGSSIIYLINPNLLQTATIVTVRCATLVAAGGRYDWLMSISSFFSLPASEGISSEIGRQKDCSQEVYQSSFSLELFDVGLSYEPYGKCFKFGREGLKSESFDPSKSTGKIEEQGVACLLAAASLFVSNRTPSVEASNDYRIGIQDIGLLLCDLHALRTLMDYDVRSLRTNHYVKIAGETLVEVVLRTDSSDGTWELSCSDCHVKINTCHDTTASLICLANQLQQLFAPDITESVMHLQTRWNSVMHLNEPCETIINEDAVKSLSVLTTSRNQDCNSSKHGVMDDILDDVFHEEATQALHPSESSGNHPYVSLSEAIPDKGHFLDATTSTSTSTSSAIFLLNSSSTLLHCSELGNVGDSSAHCLPEFIDDYYLLDSFSTQNTSGCHKYSEGGLSSKIIVSASGGTDSDRSGWYGDGSFNIVENHVPDMQYCSGHSSSNKFSSVKGELKRKGRIILDNMNATWSMFGGCDWSNSESKCSHASKTGGRDLTKCLELSLLGANIRCDIFPEGELHVSELLVSIQELHVYDNSKDAPWKMVLGYYHSKQHPRESHAAAVNLSLESVKPDPCIPLEEYRLRVSLLPLLLHLHQSQLDFLVSFFAGHQSNGQSSRIPSDLGKPTLATSASKLKIVEEALLPFFQKCDISPSVLRVDYIPQHVDFAALGGGNYVELLNLVPWKGIELRLKHVHAAGVYGWSSICETVIAEWLEDISHNQVRSLVKGLVPLRSLCSVSSGAAKLVTLPVKSYKKDHRLVKGIQRGAIAFLRSISLEAVALGVHLTGGAHDMLLQTEKILQNSPPSPYAASRIRADGAVRVNQPNDAQEGVCQAYKTLAHGLGKTASALVANPLKSYQRGASAGSALASAAKSAPAAAVAPASAAVGAIHCALLGVRNSLDPERRKESLEKYSGPQCLHHNTMR